jgi:hypothetical protein
VAPPGSHSVFFQEVPRNKGSSATPVRAPRAVCEWGGVDGFGESKSSILSSDSLSRKNVDIKDMEKSEFPIDQLVLSLVAFNKAGSKQQDIFLQQIEVAAPPSSQSSPSDSPLPDPMFLLSLAA